MGFCVEDPFLGLATGQAIYDAAVIIAVLRWVLCWVYRIIKDRRRDRSLEIETPNDPSSSSSSSWVSSTALIVTTFGEIVEKLPETEDTCAVCLNQMRVEDEVRELMNCYHVFHRECIDKWLDHDNEDNHNPNPSCPLCRAPLLMTTSSSSSCCPSESSSSWVSPTHPSWAVERLLYLFGDDLCYTDSA